MSVVTGGYYRRLGTHRPDYETVVDPLGTSTRFVPNPLSVEEREP